MKKHLPWLPCLAAAAYFFASWRLPPAKGADLNAFGRIPALQNGRIKPLDTVARTSLLMIYGKQTLSLPGRSVSASEWLLDVAAKPAQAESYKIFRIDDPDLCGLLGISPAGERYHSFAELAGSFEEIRNQARAAQDVEPRRRSRFQAAVFNLDERLNLYTRLENTLAVSRSGDFVRELQAYEAALGPGVRAVLAAHRQKPSASNSKDLAVIAQFFARYRLFAEMAYFKPLPPGPGDPPDGWLNVGEGLLESLRSGRLPEGTKSFAALADAWRRGDALEFNRQCAALLAQAEAAAPAPAAAAAQELRYNRAAPFYQGLVFYLCALILCFLSWLAWPKELGRAAFYLLAAAFMIHTSGLLARMILQGRPPVTNLYSSAVFVGWAGVLLGLVLERMHRRGLAQAVAAAIGFSTLIIAHHLSSGGDTMEMMQAVLDSNFWLSTHVVAITIGYSSTFLAGTLAHIYILRGLFSRSMSREAGRSLVQMTYGIICFSLLFSFVGTILGGIWADQSWGRFWGWDPKENGALLIVLWNAVILHARWGGYVRQRGLMLLAVGGNIFTSLSWFGVNMLGIGLHSYGWTDKAFYWLAAFIASQLVVIGLGSLPPRYWRARAALDLRPA